ncbi:unnamed protein product [Vitrella brassicaformis CCMP3155]|uniref:Uncharacterized protein n=3 Tax=Vitrella brassicaformis TaxID=1169539 RepID=A0A0G4H6H4_VITBC|nr:unnamed protein product [Vitrella brassicaformis CCMP3155]|eukprot:CEM39464.1 unnamed protein product [Vitrella brassicaformis CCMP3155]
MNRRALRRPHWRPGLLQPQVKPSAIRQHRRDASTGSEAAAEQPFEGPAAADASQLVGADGPEPTQSSSDDSAGSFEKNWDHHVTTPRLLREEIFWTRVPKTHEKFWFEDDTQHSVKRRVTESFEQAGFPLSGKPLATSQWHDHPYPKNDYAFWPNPVLHNHRLKPFYPLPAPTQGSADAKESKETGRLQALANRKRLNALWKYSSSHGISWDELDQLYIAFIQEAHRRAAVWEHLKGALRRHAEQRARKKVFGMRREQLKREGVDLGLEETDPSKPEFYDNPRHQVLLPRSLVKEFTIKYLRAWKGMFYSRYYSRGTLCRYLKREVTDRMLKREANERTYRPTMSEGAEEDSSDKEKGSKEEAKRGAKDAKKKEEPDTQQTKEEAPTRVDVLGNIVPRDTRDDRPTQNEPQPRWEGESFVDGYDASFRQWDLRGVPVDRYKRVDMLWQRPYIKRWLPRLKRKKAELARKRGLVDGVGGETTSEFRFDSDDDEEEDKKEDEEGQQAESEKETGEGKGE